MEKILKRYFPIFVLPTLIVFIIAFIIPFVMGCGLSFTSFRTVIDAQWVGFDNYVRAFSDGNFLNALGFTAGFAIVTVITINVLAFGLALILTRKLKGTNIFRTIFFMPNLIGGIVLGYIWKLIINGFLQKWAVTLTYSPSFGFWGLVILMNWQMIGYMMIIYIAGIQSIPDTLIEAAKIDGASSGRILSFKLIQII